MIKLKHRRGDSVTWTFEVLSDGLPLDLSGYSLIRFTAKANPDDADSAALIRLSTGVGGVVMLATTGQFQVTLTPNLTRDMAIGDKMYFDCQLTDSGGGVVTPFYGTITIVADVTYNAGDVGTDV